MSELLKYCNTQAQEIAVLGKEAGKTTREIALEAGVSERSIRDMMAKVKTRASSKGYDPDIGLNRPVAAHEILKGRSELVDEEGNARLTWYKTSADQLRLESLMENAVSAFSESIPRAKAVKPPKDGIEDLLNFFIITDYHVGMLAWADETGADWDVEIAEETIIRWFGLAIKAAPKAQKAVFAQLGDFQHFDSLSAITPASGHILDADTRYAKVVRVVIRIARRVTQMLLEKYPEVHVIWSDANHDPASAILHREWLAAYMADEPRCFVDVNPGTFNCLEWGLTSIFTHHGHKKKVANVGDVFAAKYREVFGRTKFSYAHTGHFHSKELKETNLMIVEQHRTLAAPDAYAARGGWISGRDASVITYHKKYGEVSRSVISFNMIEDSK